MNQTHFPFWPKRVPKKLIYPQTPIYELLETSARRYPNHPAIIYYGNRITHLQLWTECLKTAGALAEMGFRKGDRLALYMQNCPHYCIGYMGGMRTGAVVVPMNPMLVPEEFQYLLKDSGAKAVMTTSDLYPRIAEICRESGDIEIIVGSYNDYLPRTPDLPIPQALLECPPPAADVLSWQEFLGPANAPPGVDFNPDDLCLMPFTAGSTGVPKGCMHTHRTIMSNVCGSKTWSGMTSATTALAALPLFHVTGMIHSFLAVLAAGGTMVLLTRWDREAALQAFEKYRVNAWANITTMLIDLLATPGIENRDISSISHIGGGGAPLPVAVGEKLMNLTGLVYAEGYGLTETISQTHMNPPDRPKLGSVGVPQFDTDARIADVTTMAVLPPGEQGEIVINGPQVLKGYWNKPEETAQAFIELEGKNFFRTGDLGYRDDEGYFYITDRLKRMINAAGFKVWPAEVESILYRHPAVLEACVVGVPDKERVENVKAFIVLKPDHIGRVAAEEIIEWSKSRMSAYKYPRKIKFVESLPKSGAGKILWRQLQEQEKNAGSGPDS